VGGDPYLDVFRGNIAALAGRRDDARRFYRTAENSGDRTIALKAFYAHLDFSASAGEYAEVVRLLRALEHDHGVVIPPDKLAGVSVYSGFVKSPEFEAWRAGATNAPPAAP